MTLRAPTLFLALAAANIAFWAWGVVHFNVSMVREKVALGELKLVLQSQEQILQLVRDNVDRAEKRRPTTSRRNTRT
jgi:hypothetical protein